MKLYKAKIRIEDNTGTNIFNPLTYDELVKRLRGRTYKMDRFDVVSYLIGYNGVVTEDDFNNILKAREEGIIE